MSESGSQGPQSGDAVNEMLYDIRITIRRANIVDAVKDIFFHNPQCYAKLTIDPTDQADEATEQVFTTKVISGTKDPRWNEHFDVKVKPTSKIQIDIYDTKKVKKSKHGLVGTYTFHLLGIITLTGSSPKPQFSIQAHSGAIRKPDLEGVSAWSGKVYLYFSPSVPIPTPPDDARRAFRITVREAKALCSTGITKANYDPSSFVYISVDDNRAFATKVAEDTSFPEYEEYVDLLMLPSSTIRFAVHDSKKVSDETGGLIGTAEIVIRELEPAWKDDFIINKQTLDLMIQTPKKLESNGKLVVYLSPGSADAKAPISLFKAPPSLDPLPKAERSETPVTVDLAASTIAPENGDVAPKSSAEGKGKRFASFRFGKSILKSKTSDIPESNATDTQSTRTEGGRSEPPSRSSTLGAVGTSILGEGLVETPLQTGNPDTTEPKADALEDLPEGWEVRIAVDGKPYYANKHTGVTTWTDPRQEKVVLPSIVKEPSMSEDGQSSGEPQRESSTEESKPVRRIPGRLPPSVIIALRAASGLRRGSLPPTIVDITWKVETMGEIVTTGGSCDLYKGKLRGGEEVAIKRPRVLMDLNADILHRFNREADVWAGMKHQNILPFLGTYQPQGERIHLVAPWCSLGNAFNYIRAHPLLSYKDRHQLLSEMAEGLAYVHRKNVVHGDMKLLNVVLSKDGTAQLCDFGLSKLVDGTTSDGLKGYGTCRWVSPEIHEGGPKSPQGDMYAFGMCILEVPSKVLAEILLLYNTLKVIKGDVPFPSLTIDSQVILKVMKGVRPEQSPETSPDGVSYAVLWKLAQQCWSPYASTRPRAVEATKALKTEDL